MIVSHLAHMNWSENRSANCNKLTFKQKFTAWQHIKIIFKLVDSWCCCRKRSSTWKMDSSSSGKWCGCAKTIANKFSFSLYILLLFSFLFCTPMHTCTLSASPMCARDLINFLFSKRKFPRKYFTPLFTTAKLDFDWINNEKNKKKNFNGIFFHTNWWK